MTTFVGALRASSNVVTMALLDHSNTLIASQNVTVSSNITDKKKLSLTVGGLPAGIYKVVVSYTVSSGSGDGFLYLHGWDMRIREEVPTTEAIVDENTFEYQPHYRFGFQGQERDDEMKGVGNSWNYKYRLHDPRLGRFFAVDPLAAKYPFYSQYVFSGNRVVDAVELEGLEPAQLTNGFGSAWIPASDHLQVPVEEHGLAHVSLVNPQRLMEEAIYDNTIAHFAVLDRINQEYLIGNDQMTSSEWIKSGAGGGHVGLHSNKYSLTAEGGWYAGGENYVGLYFQVELDVNLSAGIGTPSFLDFKPDYSANAFIAANSTNPFVGVRNGQKNSNTYEILEGQASLAMVGMSNETLVDLNSGQESNETRLMVGKIEKPSFQGGVTKRINYTWKTDELHVAK